MPKLETLPKWAQELISLQVKEIDSLKTQVLTLEGGSPYLPSPVSRLYLGSKHFVPNDMYRFRLTDHSHIDVRLAALDIGGVRSDPVLDINGSDYLTIIPIVANHIQIWSRDRFKAE